MGNGRTGQAVLLEMEVGEREGEEARGVRERRAVYKA